MVITFLTMHNKNQSFYDTLGTKQKYKYKYFAGKNKYKQTLLSYNKSVRKK